MEWETIETAPKVAKGWSFMLLLHGPEGDETTSIGMRWGDKFYAGSFFYSMGKEKKFEIREHEVLPTHWMPLPKPPAD